MIADPSGRLVRLLVSATLIVSALAAYPVMLRPVSRDTPVYRIAVVGDSYTDGTNQGGLGANAWTARAWQSLERRGVAVAPDVAAEGQAGYGTAGNRGSVFIDLAARAVRPDDAVVVFYGSRNDQGVPPERLSMLVHDALTLAQRTAPKARLLVIGTPWPTAEVPAEILRIRDVLNLQARIAGATFIDPIAARWFVDQPWLIGADGVHPTDAGHAYMADQIVPLIADQLPLSA